MQDEWLVVSSLTYLLLFFPSHFFLSANSLLFFPHNIHFNWFRDIFPYKKTMKFLFDLVCWLLYFARILGVLEYFFFQFLSSQLLLFIFSIGVRQLVEYFMFEQTDSTHVKYPIKQNRAEKPRIEMLDEVVCCLATILCARLEKITIRASDDVNSNASQ